MFDLRRALLKKGETESARLDEFGFRLRARTMHKLADLVGTSRAAMARAVAAMDDEAVLAELLARAPELEEAKLRDLYLAARADARAELLDELGEATPHRLA